MCRMLSSVRHVDQSTVSYDNEVRDHDTGDTIDNYKLHNIRIHILEVISVQQ